MRLDFAAHLHPPSVLPPPFRDGPMAAYVGDLLQDPKTLIETYRAAGLDGAVLSQPFYIGSGVPEAVATANDALLEWVEDHDTLFGLAALPTAAGGEAAAAELERCLEAGYHGGAVETKSDGVELTDDALEPVLELAEETGAPLFVHPKLDNSLHPDVLDDRYALNATFGREAALCESIAKVIHDGVLDRYPDLKLVYHHTGGNIASILGRLHLTLEPGFWPDWGRVKPFDEFTAQLEQLYLDTSGYDGHPGPLRAALEAFPTSQVLLGTDYPFETRTVDALKRFQTVTADMTSGRDARRILGENAFELLVNT